MTFTFFAVVLTLLVTGYTQYRKSQRENRDQQVYQQRRRMDAPVAISSPNEPCYQPPPFGPKRNQDWQRRRSA
jgi:hypothetical protein